MTPENHKGYELVARKSRDSKNTTEFIRDGFKAAIRHTHANKSAYASRADLASSVLHFVLGYLLEHDGDDISAELDALYQTAGKPGIKK